MKNLAMLMVAALPCLAMADSSSAGEETVAEEPALVSTKNQIELNTESIISDKPDDVLDENNPEALEVEEYHYGMKPDIEKVISVKSDSTVCGVVPAYMLYEDSHGERHLLRYQVMGGGCNDNG
ncbi:DUF2790 domain-containing protein [Azomonas macrocytogenes]|uniref:DUF2790 domain-containing protein n=1 Tax=Azomonas macrocytogenes TaxID=69962 RepID=A0A839T2J5_AZOMA|nr:DUF2790 domain-containing protein [Azomonas macrocytogenes]MBB3103209.1 hypothetical protein [Azomonas macrocytogenes]